MTYAIFILFCSIVSLLFVCAGLHRVTGEGHCERRAASRSAEIAAPSATNLLAIAGFGLAFAVHLSP
jgi:hypothetical protein